MRAQHGALALADLCAEAALTGMEEEGKCRARPFTRRRRNAGTGRGVVYSLVR